MPGTAVEDLLALIGQPVAGNPTQLMFERALAAAGLEAHFHTFEVPAERSADALAGLRGLGFRGALIHMPHQVAAAGRVDRLEPRAELAGAVDFVFRDDARLVGDHLAGAAFVDSLRSVVDPQGLRVLMLGGGGMARGIAAALAGAGVESLTFATRSAEQGAALAARFAERCGMRTATLAWQGPLTVPLETDLVIHATPQGMLDNDPPRLALDFVSPQLVVADVIFNPPRTELLEEVEARGHRTVDGLDTLVTVAAQAFRRWTGREPNVGLMRDAAEEFLGI